MKIKKTIIGLFLLGGVAISSVARDFVHPGLSYTSADLERMRTMITDEEEPYLTTFEALKNSTYSSLTAGVSDRGTQIKEGGFNGTVGADGRRAHDLALLWHLTGDSRYADKAVAYLNANSYYKNTSARGTAPLDNGKVYLLIEAAELMRDYEGWLPEDKQRFSDMLVYPGYSSEESGYKYANMTDSLNGITFYWNIYNFDASRFGNQGLFAARAMIAMAVFLDNEKMYDRVVRYILGQPHRDDDLAYVSGPALTKTDPYPLNEADPTAGDNTTSFMKGYQLIRLETTIPDYGYDEQLQHYIYPSGQSQEACRDQDHGMVGVGLLGDIAEIAWNQNDDIYSALDNRILKGMEWCFRYNYSYIKDPENAWEPEEYVTDPEAATFENNAFLQIRSRSGRWESVKPSTKGRGDSFMAGGNREQTLAHYAGRMKLPATDYTWLKDYRDYMVDTYGHESYGKDANHRYEWKGWGSLTKRLDPIMAGVDVPTDVSEISVETGNGEARYFLPTGVESDGSLPGIYIEVKDGKSRKIVKR